MTVYVLSYLYASGHREIKTVTSTLLVAQRIAEKRQGVTSLNWESHNSHGPYWSALSYTIEGFEVETDSMVKRTRNEDLL